MRVLLILILVLLVQVNAVAARKRAIQKIFTEGNHTTSNNNLSKTFTLKDLREGKPLVIILKQKNGDKQNSVNVALSNKVNVTISDDHNQQVKCEFTRMHHMCYLKNVLSPSATKVNIQCDKSPCDELFEAVQSDVFEAKETNDTIELQAIYNVGKNNTIISLACNDSALDKYKEYIRIFANTPYDIIDRGPLLYVIFDGPIKELLILSTDKAKKCSHIKFTQNLETVQFEKVMRAYITKSRTLKINKIPTKELRVDVTAMEINDKPLKPFNITFYGLTQADKESNRQKLEMFIIKDQASDDQPTVSLDFNMIIKNRKLKDIKQMEMVIDSEQQLLLLLQFSDVDKHEMDAEQQSYFSLEKGDKLDYKIIGNKDAQKDEAVSINVLPNSNVDYNTSETPCRYQSGCSVTVTAKENTSTVLTTTLARQRVKDISYLELNQSLSLSLNEGEIKYLIHNQSSTQNKMIRVSSPNVIVYVSGEKCLKPSQKCFQFSGNFQKIINVENHTGPIYISVEGLELVKFTITIAEANSMIQLKEGVATPVNMQKDKEVYLRFRIDKKQTVNFNLIAPVNAFAMYVLNGEELPDSEDLDLATSSSFLKINQDEVDKLIFTILIKRLTDREDERFTIIASTDHATIMLDRSQPHYDLLEADESRSFVTLVKPQDLDNKIETILSFSVFQKTEDTINLTITFSGPSNDSAQEVSVARRDTAININTYADLICDQQEDEQVCEIFIRVVNNNKQKLDITLAILINNSIIQLKSGVWQRYEMTSVTSSTHFYFYPNNKKYPVTVQFSHTFAVYKLAYNLWNNELKETNPGLWPYPNPTGQPISPGIHTSEYTIHPEEIAKCFPNCVVLISLWNANQKPETNPNIVAPIFNNFGSYIIMATDNIIELLEEHKLTISLGNNETKYLLVSITAFLDTNKTLTFISSDVVGYHSLLVSVSSNKNMTLPTEDSFDWRFELYESQLSMEDIKKKLVDKGMDTHEQVDLVILAKGYTANKFIFQFSSKDDFMQSLSIGVPQPIAIPANQERVYTVDYYLNYRVKLIRRKSFPYLTYKACSRNSISDCLEEMKKTKAIQITSKADEFRSENCNFCVLIIKIQAKDDPVEADLVALGDASSVQLNEGVIITDFAVAKEFNQYKLSIVNGVDAIITITVFQGDPKVTALNTFYGINITGKRSGNLIRIIVNSALFERKQKSLNLSFFTQNYALSSIFSELTVIVTDEKLNCSFSIVYTVGERHINILDGVLVSELLKKNDTVSYNYHNQAKSSVIVSISFNDTEMLQNCEIVIRSYNGSDEEPVKTKPEKMEIHKKTPKPSLTFNLNESYSDYQILLRNLENKDISFNLTINHVDMVLLPFDYLYPSSLAANESAYFIVEVFNDGYIYFTVKKCANSDLMISYALDDDAFEKQEFAFTTTIEENTFTSFVHVKASTIYVKINSDYGMIYSIKASWFQTKKDVPKESVKPGNKGFVDYEITGVQEATVTFSPIICNSTYCPKVEYYYLLSSNRDQVVSQTECPSSFFLQTSLKPVKAEHIKPQKGSIPNTYQFKLKMPKELTHLGVKAILEDGKEVTYNVIEVATIWGTLQKNKHYHISLLILALLCCCFCLCMRYRRSNRDGKGKYAGLRESDS